jgi:hypothetical protein
MAIATSAIGRTETTMIDQIDPKRTFDDTAASSHGGLRLIQAFDLAQTVSEFRTLRASVIRLWSAQPEVIVSASSSELIRFNEAHYCPVK